MGGFAEVQALIDPALPLVAADRRVSLAQAVQIGRSDLWMPTSAPPGATSALILNRAPGPAGGAGDPAQLVLIYSGEGRRLAIQTSRDLSGLLTAGETVTANGVQFTLQAGPAQIYQAATIREIAGQPNPAATRVSAAGYTRAELLDVLRTLGPPTIEAYRAQARLFADPLPPDAAFEALLGALAPRPAPSQGGARHFVERVFKRHAAQPDQLRDPYHRPPYGGWPEQWLQDNWARTAADGTLETFSTSRGDDSKVLLQQYRGAAVSWDYDASASRLYQFPSGILGRIQHANEEQSTVERMLACGGARLETRPGGRRSLVLREPHWRVDSCQNPAYPGLWGLQRNAIGATDEAPYLDGLADETLTTVIDLGSDGRPARTQVWSGQPESGTLLESWELVSEEIVPAEHVPAAAFDPSPPAALVRFNIAGVDPAGRIPPRTVTIGEALELGQSPLFTLSLTPPRPAASSSTGQPALPPGAMLWLDQIAAGLPPDVARDHGYSDEGNVFEQALSDGYALRLTYALQQGAGAQSIHLYEGSSRVLGAYLRSQAQWMSSVAAKLLVDGRQVDGWWMIARSGASSWLLCEVDGTLLAVEHLSPDQLAALGGVRRLTRRQGDKVTR